MLEKLKDNYRYLLFLLTIPFLHIFYEVLNERGGNAVLLYTQLDGSIPFVKEFVIPYIGWYFFMIGYLVYFCFKDKKLFFKTLITINIGMIICYVVYYFYQTTVPRPFLLGDDIFTFLVKMIYAKDQPYNCFPSIHVLTTYAIMLYMYRSNIKSLFHRYFVYGFGVAIIASTVFLKQHSVWDGFASIVMVHILYHVVSYTYAYLPVPIFEQQKRTAAIAIFRNQ